MICVLYSCGCCGRIEHEFKTLDPSVKEDAKQILKGIIERSHNDDEQYHVYNISTTSHKSRLLSLYDLQEDYNDEMFDGGHFMAFLNLIEEETLQIMRENVVNG